MLRDGKESASNMCNVNASFVVGSCNFLFILKHVFDTKKNVLCKKVQEGRMHLAGKQFLFASRIESSNFSDLGPIIQTPFFNEPQT